MLVAQSCLTVTPWTAAHQAPLSRGFSRQEYWSGLPLSPPGDLPKPGIKPTSPVSSALQVDSLLSEGESHSVVSDCDPMDCSPPGSPVRGILPGRILEWVAISFSRGSSQPRDRTRVSCIAGRRFILWAIYLILKYNLFWWCSNITRHPVFYVPIWKPY